MTIVPFLNKVDQFILNPIIGLLFAVSFVYFAYGVVKFVRMDSADTSREEAKNAILYGILGMLIMISVYGIINFVLTSFGISKTDVSNAGLPL